MTTIRHILCPLDFSRFSRHALEQAVSIAREFGAEISALHVRAMAAVPELVAAGSPPAVVPFGPAPIERSLLLQELRDLEGDVEAAGVTIRTAIEDGDPVKTIVSQAAAWPADMIVMGTHGRTGFERLLLGSVAERVLRKAPCPVLTVPPRATSATSDLAFARILCAVDLSPASMRALEYAATLAAKDGPGVDVLNVVELLAEEHGLHEAVAVETPSFRAELARAAARRLDDAIPAALRERCRLQPRVTMGKAWKEILRVASEERSDLIVLGVQGRSTADLMLFGSTTQHVVRQASCPVLTIRAGNDARVES